MNHPSPPPFCRDPLANLDLQVNRETQAYRYTSIFTQVLPNEAKYVWTKPTLLLLNTFSSSSGLSWFAGAYRSARSEGKLHKSCFISVLKHWPLTLHVCVCALFRFPYEARQLINSKTLHTHHAHIQYIFSQMCLSTLWILIAVNKLSMLGIK